MMNLMTHRSRHFPSFAELIAETGIRLFLVDASGVLYNDEGPVLGIAATVREMQRVGDVVVVTNNTSHYVTQISENLARFGMDIPSENILSSGFGLAIDPDIHAMIRGKSVYVFGTPESYAYVENAGCRRITQNVQEADIIIMTSSLKEKTEEELEKIRDVDVPVICPNPDRYVMGPEGRIPVVGYYAERLGRPIHWMGKPYSNFSWVVKKWLEPRFELNAVCFFDDNLENVLTIQRDLGFWGCCVTQTGLSRDLDVEAVKEKPSFWLPSLGSRSVD